MRMGREHEDAGPSGHSQAVLRVGQDRQHLFLRDAGKPFQEIVHSRALLDVLKQRLQGERDQGSLTLSPLRREREFTPQWRTSCEFLSNLRSWNSKHNQLKRPGNTCSFSPLPPRFPSRRTPTTRKFLRTTQSQRSSTSASHSDV